MKQGKKKVMAILLAAALAVSATGCGKAGTGGQKSEKNADTNADTKNMVYQGEDFAVEGLEGDFDSFFVKGDKLYISTYEWIEGKGASEEGTSEEESLSTGTSEEGTSEEGTSEESTSEEGTSEEGTSEEGTSEEGTSEESTSEEGTSEESTSEEGTSEEDASDEETDQGIEEGTSIQRLYCMNVDGSGLEELTMPERKENEYIGGMQVNSAGNMLYNISSYDEKTESQNMTLVEADKTGKVIQQTDLNKLLKLSSADSYIGSMCVDAEDNIILVSDQNVYVVDKSFKLAGEVKGDSWLGGVVATSDGRVFGGMDSEDGAVVCELDVKNLKWGEKYKVDIRYFSSSDSMMAGEGYDFYYSDDNGVYGYDIKAKKSVKLIDYLASDISTEYTYRMIPFGTDQFLTSAYDEELGKSKLVVYSKVDPSTIANKTTITVGMMWVDYDVKRMILDFNKSNQEYRIEIKSYENEEDPMTKMNADFVAGNVPDIMCLNNLPYEQYIAKGMLEDLTPYLEKDPEIKESDFIPSVLEAMKTDGKLYYVAPSFYVSTMIADKKLVGDTRGWTFAEMKELLDQQKEGVRPFEAESKEYMLSTFLWGIGSDFVDWTTGECRFDSQEFKDILELCNTGIKEEEVDYENSESTPTLVKEGKVLFQTTSVNLDEIQLYKKMYNSDITFVGYPNEDKDGSYFSFNGNMAIYSKSQVKDGAWEFLRTLLTKEGQGKKASYAYEIPTRQDAFDMFIKARTTTKNYTDEYGNEITPYQSGWGWDDLSVDIGPSSEEDVAMFKDLINNTKKVASDNNSLYEIVSEEAKAYFAGDKDVNETAKIIQNRVATYVNENR